MALALFLAAQVALAKAAVVPPLVYSFAATEVSACGGGFMGCPPKGRKSSTFYAQDFAGDTPVMRRGPTSLLPAHENQIAIWNYHTGVQHAMYVDATASPPRVINCSRVQEGTQTGTAMRESWAGYLLYPQTQQHAAPQTCTGCEQWNYVQSGAAPCPSPSSPPRSTNETLVYLLGPAVPTRGGIEARHAAARPILNLTNVIHQTVCAGTAPIPEMWATSDWQQGFVAPAAQALFAVPDDSDCPLVATGEAPSISALTWATRLARRGPPQ